MPSIMWYLCIHWSFGPDPLWWVYEKNLFSFVFIFDSKSFKLSYLVRTVCACVCVVIVFLHVSPNVETAWGFACGFQQIKLIIKCSIAHFTYAGCIQFAATHSFHSIIIIFLNYNMQQCIESILSTLIICNFFFCLKR